MTLETSSKLRQLIRLYIHPLLKELGFRRKALRWNRERGQFVDLISVQKATYSTECEEVFTVNLGVFAHWFYNTVWQVPHVGIVSEVDCTIRPRLGELIQDKPFGGAFDQWWTLTSIDDVKTVGTEVKTALINKALPFFQSIVDYRVINDHLDRLVGWQSKNELNKIYHALAKWKIGEKVESERILNQIAPCWKERADLVLDCLRTQLAVEMASGTNGTDTVPPIL